KNISKVLRFILTGILRRGKISLLKGSLQLHRLPPCPQNRRVPHPDAACGFLEPMSGSNVKK
ncbi:MAG: hypothetical protein IJ357_06690, partial [Oscillospiraceae bacterium]|nr:hypothetical protein [Oscillospiraceae bacterium]